MADSDTPGASEPPAVLTTNGCVHYRRNCKLRAPCCGELFTCRLCHDLVKLDGEKDLSRQHRMNRHDVKAVVCVTCDTEQPPASHCSCCGECSHRHRV